MRETEHKTTLKPFNFKSFHKSLERSGLRLQANIPSWLGKIFRLTLFTLLENEFLKFPSWHDLTVIFSMQIGLYESIIIFFLRLSMGVLEPAPLVFQIARFFKVLYPMNEECIMRPA